MIQILPQGTRSLHVQIYALSVYASIPQLNDLAREAHFYGSPPFEP